MSGGAAGTREANLLPQDPVLEDLDNEPTWEVFHWALKSLPNNKVTGVDGVPWEMQLKRKFFSS